MNTFNKGRAAESKAADFLESKGFKIIEKNFYCKGGEIDIIAFKNDTFHFVEVKSGRDFEPVYNITPQKIKRITKCLFRYVQKNKITSAYCISAVIIKENSIELIENLTL
ncbi:YraN family protein [Caminibacter pacificus]|jgi:putative endonuclease